MKIDGVTIPPGGVQDYTAGDIFVTKSDVQTDTQSTSWKKAKEILMGNGGTLRVKFDLKGAIVDRDYKGRIYRNGGAVGTERINATTNWITFSEDISGWSAGDLLQLYIYGQGAGWNAFTRNLRVYSGTKQSGFEIKQEEV